ncbi:MAG TPA: hypothetical protein VMZ90_01485, partial [Vicinamibacterales bacterium]|nr:hypothetical protein [Vicinamibacterales bacterium]
MMPKVVASIATARVSVLQAMPPSRLRLAWQHRSAAVRRWLKPDPSKHVRIGRSLVALILLLATTITAL